MANKDPTIKSHLLIQDKFLGALLYLKDTKGRSYLKLSFKNKIEGFNKGTDISTILPVPAKLDGLIGLDISYKFEDRLLEVKKVIGNKVQPEFYQVPLPISSELFTIRIKDWHSLATAQNPDRPLVLTPPSSKSVAIVFSFLGDNDQPFKPSQYEFPMGMGMIDLPETPLSQICIGIAEDLNNVSVNGFEIYIPYPKQNI